MSSRWHFTGFPLSRRGRLGLLILSGLLMAGFGLARSMEPDPRGFGTHQQLGFPECTFQFLWNRPCPGCGMTTCFAALMHGNWSAALRANPAGVLLAVVCSLLIPWMWASAWRGETVGVTDPLQATVWLLFLIATVTAGVWFYRLGM